MEFPLPMYVPPQLPEYQYQAAPVPSEPPFLVNVVEPPHVGFGVAVIEEGAPD